MESDIKNLLKAHQPAVYVFLPPFALKYRRKGGIDMNRCKAFDMTDRYEQAEHLRGLVPVEDYGDTCNGHDLYTWDDGYRRLCRCPECNALVLVQFSEFHGRDDSYYKDYFHVNSRDEAIALNEKYDGWQIERESGVEHIFRTF